MLGTAQVLSAWAILSMGTTTAPQASTRCNSTARRVVEEYLRYDSMGFLLSSQGHEAIWKLTEENGEPPEAPETVTKTHKVISMAGSGRTCRATIRFTTYGYFMHESLVFHPHAANETWTVFLNCNRNDCKIDLDLKKFGMPTHPGKAATLEWLKGLEEMQETRAERDSVHRVWSQIARLK
jgi:hypothetical protein